MINPLLTLQGLPPFTAIQPQHVEPAIDEVLNDNRAAIARLLGGGQAYTWSDLVEPLEELAEEFLPDEWLHPTEAQLEAGHGGGDYLEVQDFVRSIIEGAPPPIDLALLRELCAQSSVPFPPFKAHARSPLEQPDTAQTRDAS